MMRIQLQSLLKTLNRILHTVLARSDDAEIVPGVGESIWIVGWQFDGVLESFARSRVFGLVQVDTSDAVGGFGAGWIVTQGLPERRFSLIKISALEKERAIREVVAAEFESIGCTWERQCPRQSLRVGLRNILEVGYNVVGDDWALIHLDDTAVAVEQERYG